MVPSILVTCGIMIKGVNIHSVSESDRQLPTVFFPHRDMVVVLRHVDKRRQALAEPHSDLSVHVDGEGFEALLKAAHGVVLEGAGVFAQVHATHLRQAKAADWNEP